MSVLPRRATRSSRGSAPRTSSSFPTMATATMRDGTDTARSSINSSHSIFWIGLRDGSRRERMTDDAVRKYWQDTLDELARYPARAEIDVLPLRATPFATLYGVRLTSLGPYRVFGYLSIPTGTGPFPAIYYPPKYQSVLEIIGQGTANLQRSRDITLALAGRGQRLADTPYAAMFPGLLTEGIDNAASYIFRGIVADSVRGFNYLLTRPELDAARVVVMGNDMALATAALSPGVTHVVTAPALFYNTAALAPRTEAYPL